MTHRIFSTVVIWLSIVLVVALFGAQGAVWIAALTTALTQWELYKIFDRMGWHSYPRAGVVTGLFIVLGAYYLPGVESGTEVFGVAFVVLCLAIQARSMVKGQLGSFMPTLFGLVYVPYMMQYFVGTIQLAVIEGYGEGTGIFLCVWIVAAAKFTDVGGLLIGKQFGKHKLAPHISPGKTWEGVIGGVFVSAIVVILLVALNGLLDSAGRVHVNLPEGFSWWIAALMTAPVAIVSVASDLIESGFKRAARIKDSGSIVPGIGGVFDLTDSVILCAPLGFILLKYVAFA